MKLRKQKLKQPTPPFQPWMQAVAKNYKEKLVTWNPKCIKSSALFYQFEAADDTTITLFPDGCCNMIFCCDKENAEGIFSGVSLHPKTLTLKKGSLYFGCKPYSVLGLQPKGLQVGKLLNTSVDFTFLYPTSFKFIRDLANAENFSERIHLLSSFKQEEMLCNMGEFEVVDQVTMLLCIENDADLHDMTQMQYLEKSLGYSIRHLRQKFGETFGFPPNYYSRIMRFQSSLKDVCGDEEHRLVDIAYHNGYFDQSHFIREFKTFTTLSPSSLQEKLDQVFLEYDTEA